ncbi:hypothetical protein GCM10007269_32080 [Microbacterium murale]|uniref:Uncharacterized protein n=1 Tax=Microbacterium murale TaxID=1081040 RepID=A0ABQ1S0B0_9MICO|nr:hypothetical protein GCM10007269_32080 [Microbacterium murale]
MPRYPSPWRVNDAVLHDALRDEFRSAIAAVMAAADDSGDEAVGLIRQLRSDIYDTDGFDRSGVASHLAAGRSPTRATPERSRDRR